MLQYALRPSNGPSLLIGPLPYQPPRDIWPAACRSWPAPRTRRTGRAVGALHPDSGLEQLVRCSWIGFAAAPCSNGGWALRPPSAVGCRATRGGQLSQAMWGDRWHYPDSRSAARTSRLWGSDAVHPRCSSVHERTSPMGIQPRYAVSPTRHQRPHQATIESPKAT